MIREITFEALNGLVAGADLSQVKTYLLDDGRINARFFQCPVNYLDAADGIWKSIDTILEETGGEELDGEIYDVRNVKNAFRVRLKKNAKAPQRVDVPGKGALVVRAVGGNASLATVAGNKATYPDAWDNVDWMRTVLRGRVKSDFILKTSAAPNEFRFRLQGIGLTYAMQESGELYWLKDGVFAARFGAPSVVDNNGTAGTVTQTLDGNELVITVDPTWLAAAAFPVTLDPDTFYSTASDAYISSGDDVYATAQAGTGTTLAISGVGAKIYVGQATGASPNGMQIYRIYLYFTTSTIGAQAVISAASLFIYCSNDYTTSRDFAITAVSHTAEDPPTTADWGDVGSTSGGSVSTNGISTAAYTEIALNATGQGWVNTTGTTKIALRSDYDIASDDPAGDEYMGIYASEQTGTDNDPYLSVTYTNAWTKSAAATITFTPTTTKTASKSMAATVSLAGVMTALKTIFIAASATITLSASTVKAVGKAMTASITFTPVTTKAVEKAMSAALSLAVTTSKQLGKAASATLTLAASMTKKPGKAAAATVTLAGTTVKAVSKAMAVTITYTPTTAKKWAMAAAAAISVAASMTKKAGKAMTATITVARQRLWGVRGRTSGDFTSRRIVMGSRTPWTETSDGGTSWTETE